MELHFDFRVTQCKNVLFNFGHFHSIHNKYDCQSLKLATSLCTKKLLNVRSYIHELTNSCKTGFLCNTCKCNNPYFLALIDVHVHSVVNRYKAQKFCVVIVGILTEWLIASITCMVDYIS